MAIPYTKENVEGKLVETLQDYQKKHSNTNRADERLLYAIAEEVINKLIVEFEKEFE